jgi:hypothetical protein
MGGGVIHTDNHHHTPQMSVLSMADWFTWRLTLPLQSVFVSLLPEPWQPQIYLPFVDALWWMFEDAGDGNRWLQA